MVNLYVTEEGKSVLNPPKLKSNKTEEYIVKPAAQTFTKWVVGGILTLLTILLAPYLHDKFPMLKQQSLNQIQSKNIENNGKEVKQEAH